MVLRSGIECYRPRVSPEWRVDSLSGGEDRVAVVLSWAGQDGFRVRRAQLLTLRGGRIVRMRDYSSPNRAIRAAGIRRRSATVTSWTVAL